METQIYILTNTSGGQYIGDRNQAVGIQKFLKIILTQQGDEVSIHEYDVGLIDKLVGKLLLEPNSKHVVIAVGDHGITSVKELEPYIQTLSNLLILWAGHREFPDLIGIKGLVDIIALPEHVLDLYEVEKRYEGSKANVISTIGVAHNVWPEGLEKALKETDLVIPESEFYTGVFLGGDVIDDSGKEREIKCFTPEEAVELANIVAGRIDKGNTIVLVTNGPRTGMYNNPEEPNSQAHRGDSVDKTSEAFIGKLEKLGIRTFFQDYVHGKPSRYELFLALVQKTGGAAYVTGDSTSMVTEIVDSLRRPRTEDVREPNVYVALVGSMTRTHCAHIKSCYRAGLVEIVGSHVDYSLSTQMHGQVLEAALPAAEKIAREVINILSHSKPPILPMFSNRTNEGPYGGSSCKQNQHPSATTSGDLLRETVDLFKKSPLNGYFLR